MVAMAATHPNHSGANDKESEAVEAIEELKADLGTRGLVAAILRSSIAEYFEKHGANTTLAVLQEILREIVFSEDPQLEAEIMALGTGVLVMENQTVGRVGDKHSLSKQAVSKRVIAFCVKWKLPPSAFMRSEKDRRTYSMTNKPRVT
jgi:hypothetical protein